MNQILELVRSCPYCKRESLVPSLEWDENPYCHSCLRERLEAARAKVGKVTFKHVGNYAVLMPASQTGS